MARPGTQLHRLQNSPHHIKLRWLVALSVAAMLLVIALWVAAFPAMVALAPPSTSENPNPKPQLSGTASVFQSLFGTRQ